MVLTLVNSVGVCVGCRLLVCVCGLQVVGFCVSVVGCWLYVLLVCWLGLVRFVRLVSLVLLVVCQGWLVVGFVGSWLGVGQLVRGVGQLVSWLGWFCWLGWLVCVGLVGVGLVIRLVRLVLLVLVRGGVGQGVGQGGWLGGWLGGVGQGWLGGVGQLVVGCWLLVLVGWFCWCLFVGVCLLVQVCWFCWLVFFCF